MHRRWPVEISVFVLLVVLGIGARVLLHERYPNFAPVAAIALFAGYYFRSGWLALAAPILVMALSNRLIEQGYSHWLIMASVYGCLALPVACRQVLRKYFNLEKGTMRQSWAACMGLVGCGLASSLMFFFVTNFAVWIVSDMYAHTGSDFVRCFVQALPFFRFTLAGDLTFALLFFGGHAACARIVAGNRSEATASSMA